MDRIVIIANPAASQFTGGSLRTVMGLLSSTSEVEAVWPDSAAEATTRSRQAAANEASLVLAMGGDGMVHHVLQGLVGSETPMGIIPAGTTNVAARWLDIPSKPERAAKLVAGHPDPQSIGLVRLSAERGATSTTHHAMFSTGFGLDAAVVAEADKEPYRKYRFGSLHYARTAIGVGLGRFAGRRPHVTVKAGSMAAHAVAGLIQFRDVYTYFGKIGVTLSPETPDPMTALIIERLPRRRAPKLIGRAIRKGDLGGLDQMETWPEITSLSIVADPPVPVQADGEYLGLVDGAKFEWVPNAAKVISGRVLSGVN